MERVFASMSASSRGSFKEFKLLGHPPDAPCRGAVRRRSAPTRRSAAVGRCAGSPVGEFQAEGGIGGMVSLSLARVVVIVALQGEEAEDGITPDTSISSRMRGWKQDFRPGCGIRRHCDESATKNPLSGRGNCGECAANGRAWKRNSTPTRRINNLINTT